MLWLFNHETLSHELKLELASGICIPVQNLVNVVEDRDIWSQLFESNSIFPAWENVWAYVIKFTQDELDDSLVNYLRAENVSAPLSMQKIDHKYCRMDDGAYNLITLILSSSKLGANAINMLLLSVPSDYAVSDLETVCDEYIPLLIIRNLVDFSPANYAYVCERCRKSLGSFVNNNRSIFMSLIPELNVDGESLFLILNKTQRNITKKNIVQEVLKHGVPENLSAVASQICDLLLSDATFSETLEAKLLATVLVATPDCSLKIKCLACYMKWLGDAEITAVLESAGGGYREITIRDKRPGLPLSPINEKLANSLLSRGYVSSVTPEEQFVRINTFKGSRGTEQE